MNDIKKLKAWFASEARDLPWRTDRSPYSVWVSEMMLQQTQVSVVIPYFLRWMERFPDVKTLAEAPLEDVIKLWEGLGYYSRARYLYQGAKYLLEHHRGVFPSDPKSLSKIKGVGAYTVGAICSFAFQQKIPAVDGNVKRVLARYFCVEEEINKTTTLQKLNRYAEQLLPEKEPWIVSEALIELGATICMRKPKCEICPLKNGCQGFQQGKAVQLPYNVKKTLIQNRFRAVAVIQYKDHLLVRHGQPGEIMQDLYEFPYVEIDAPEIDENFERKIAADFCCKLTWKQDLPMVKHSFTRFRVQLFPKLFEAKTKPVLPQFFELISLDQIHRFPFSSGHRRLLQTLNHPI